MLGARMPTSPPRMAMLSVNSQLVPLSLTSKPEDIVSKVSINPVKVATSISNGNGTQMMAALNLKAPEVPSSCQTMPLNLHAAVSSTANIQPPLNGLRNGYKGYNG